MIDFLKIETEIIDYELFKSELKTDIESTICIDSSEIIPYFENKLVKKYKHIARIDSFLYEVYEIYDKTRNETKYKLFISGSIHKNHFNGSNFEDFSHSMLVYQIKKLIAIKGIDKDKMFLRNLEVGINIQVSFKTIDYLSENILIYKGKPFNYYDYDKKGVSIGYYRDLPKQFMVKIYDKSLQNNLPFNLLRYEIKYFKMQTINQKGIYYLSDLCNKSNLEKLHRQILTKFDYILLNEKPKKRLNKTRNAYYLKVSSPRFWEKLSKAKNNVQFQNERRKFEAFKSKYCSNIKNTLKSSMEAKFEELIEK